MSFDVPIDDLFLSTIGSVCSVVGGFSLLFWGFVIDRVPYKVL